jgi:hypothetical protein
MPPPFDQNANEARKASGRRLFSERGGDNHENPDRDLLETAIIATVVLAAAVASSFGWTMVSHLVSDPTHAAQHKMERTDIEAPHHVPQHADRPMTRAGWIEDRSISWQEETCQLVRVARTCNVCGAGKHECKRRNSRYTDGECALAALAGWGLESLSFG